MNTLLDNAAIGRRLEELRHLRGLTRDQLAAKAVVHWPKITSHMLYHAETGRRQIKYAEALALATALESSWTLSTLDAQGNVVERGVRQHIPMPPKVRVVCAAPTTGACAITALSLMTCRSAATRSPNPVSCLLASTSPTRPLSPITLIARGSQRARHPARHLRERRKTHDRQ